MCFEFQERGRNVCVPGRCVRIHGPRAGIGRAACLLLAVVLMWGASLGVATRAGAEDPLPGVEQNSDPLRTLVLLDVSGSMARDGGHGGSLLDGARRALAEL